MVRSSSRLPSDFTPNPLTRALEERRRGGGRILDLTQSNPTRVRLPTPGPEQWRALISGAAAPYEPEALGSPAARQAVSAYYGDRDIELDPDRVVLTASTSEAYTHLFRVLCDAGDEVLVPEPSYPLFGPLAALEAVRAVPYLLRAGSAGWGIDLETVEAGLGPRTRALVLVHPNNPTGSLVGLDESEALERLCARRGLALVADEVFGDYLFPPPIGREDRRGSLAAGAGTLTFVLSGLSKVCGLPQAKLAWIAIAGPEDEGSAARQRLEWVADAFLSVSPAVQAVLPSLLANRRVFQESARARLAGNLAALEGALAGASGSERLPLDGGWTAVVRVPAPLSDDALALALARRGVAVHPGHFFDFAEDGYLVLSLLPEPETFAEALRELRSILSETRSSEIPPVT